MLSRSSGGGLAGPGCGPGRSPGRDCLRPDARCRGRRAMGGDLMAREWDVAGYTEVKTLGSGGVGDVVLAPPDASGAAGAIKDLRRQLLAHPTFTSALPAAGAGLAAPDD